LNQSVKLESCEFFTVNLLEFNSLIEKDFQLLDSFVIYLCIDGKIDIQTEGNEIVTIQTGDTVLIPASIRKLILNPSKTSKILEIYIK